MYEYHLLHVDTEEANVIMGYTLEDAFRRSKLNPNEWSVYHSEYVD